MGIQIDDGVAGYFSVGILIVLVPPWILAGCCNNIAAHRPDLRDFIAQAYLKRVLGNAWYRVSFVHLNIPVNIGRTVRT